MHNLGTFNHNKQDLLNVAGDQEVVAIIFQASHHAQKETDDKAHCVNEEKPREVF